MTQDSTTECHNLVEENKGTVDTHDNTQNLPPPYNPVRITILKQGTGHCDCGRDAPWLPPRYLHTQNE